MARHTAGLTARSAETLGPGLHGDGGGLYLSVAATGSRSWIFRYQRHGKRRDMGLGPLHLVGLSEARRRSHECRDLLFRGIDPLDRRHGERTAAVLEAAKVTTFKQCADAYLTSHRAAWRSGSSHARVFENSLRDHAATIMDLPVAAIDTGVVMKALQPIWTEKPETATRLRGRIESILDYAKTAGYRQGENPARWRGHLENLLPSPNKVKRVAHHPALPYAEIAEFMTELRQRRTVGARALEFAILTAARTGEVLEATWNEIDVANRLWTVPADRMKSGREHRVPLSDAVTAIIEEMAEGRSGPYVFPGQRSGQPLSAGGALLAVLRRMGRGDLTTHGFRSTFRDWAAERTSYPAEVAEMALAHSVGSAVEQAYRRSDLFERRRRLMDDWARFCAAQAAESANVVPIGAAD
jgi:integrase